MQKSSYHMRCGHYRPQSRIWLTHVFGHSSAWAEYWKRNMNETWFREHPQHHFIKLYPHLAVPFVIHGDGAPIGKTRDLRVIQWSSPIVLDHTTLSKTLVCSMNDSKNLMSAHHERSIDEVIAWSFRVAGQNKHPSHSHDGKQMVLTVSNTRICIFWAPSPGQGWGPCSR